MTIFDIRKRRLQSKLRREERKRKARSVRFGQEQELRSIEKKIAAEQGKFEGVSPTERIRKFSKQAFRGGRRIASGAREAGRVAARTGSSILDIAERLQPPPPKRRGKKKKRRNEPFDDGRLLRLRGF